MKCAFNCRPKSCQGARFKRRAAGEEPSSTAADRTCATPWRAPRRQLCAAEISGPRGASNTRDGRQAPSAQSDVSGPFSLLGHRRPLPRRDNSALRIVRRLRLSDYMPHHPTTRNHYWNAKSGVKLCGEEPGFP
ncbi:hypothetical protein MRX96_005244 [Rhipicephalus microplus]